MSYTALPDRRMPYHRDGTVVYRGFTTASTSSAFFGLGPNSVLSSAQRIELNDDDSTDTGEAHPETFFTGFWFFFPELREVTAYAHLLSAVGAYSNTAMQGSNDSTNGMDGTWESASLPGGASIATLDTARDAWRTNIKAVSFTGAKRVLRLTVKNNGALGNGAIYGVDLYGEKAAGQTPDDLIFINHDDTPGVEYTAPEDFGDRPLGTSAVRQFRVKNASPTKTANAINLQCNDADFTISTDNVNWVVTINIASLAAGAESSTMYVRNTTPAAGSLLGPREAEIVAIVGSWT